MSPARDAALRTDIQALRGFAVAVVIVYHAGFGLVPGGFLGVDLFFVVSGFLIGGHVLRGLDEGSFRFGDFYLRRLRRLAPVAYAVLFACLIAAALLLTADAHARFAAQALGTLTYTTNIVLWQQINYFNTSAASEPLLHMWSLAIEEQFYLLLPLALWALPGRWRLAAIVAVTLASLGLYLFAYPRSPGAAFYLLPTRAWELGLGVCAALVATSARWQRLTQLLRLPALVLVLGPVLLPLPVAQHWLALPVSLGTALLLVAAFPAHRALWPLVRTGDASYSLYLVHWPLFAFAHVLWLGAPLPWHVGTALVLASGVLGWLSWRWIEQPGRYVSIAPRRVVAIYGAATIALGALAWGSAAWVAARPVPLDLAGVQGIEGPGCDGAATRFDGRCTQSAAPQLLVWGDSFSQQLVPGLLAGGAPAIAQASKGQCAPLLGLAPVDRDAMIHFARGCHHYNASVIEWLARTPSVRVVVLSAYYQRYAQTGTAALRADGTIRPADLADLVAAQQRTSAAIRALGKRVIVVTGPPTASFDIGQCWARRLGGLPSVAPAADCTITPAGASPAAEWSEGLFTRLPGEAETPVIRLDRLLCPDPQRCATLLEEVPLYRDRHHLSRAGSDLVGRRLALTARVEAEAR